VRDVLHFINGAYVQSGTGGTFDKVAPATGQVVARVHEAGQAEVDRAVNAARDALMGDWGRFTVEDRCQLLYRVADGINARFDEFLAAECEDTGKPYSLARHIDIPRGAANFKIFADTVRNVANKSFEMATPDGAGALNYSVHVPKGVIGVVCPWNLPLLLMTWKVGPAMACGNTVVVKPSEETPSTAALLGEVMNEAGVPPGVYNVVHGFGPDSAGAFLTEHPGVDAITFTGETTTGEAIMRAAAKGVRDVSFELGGKNPGIVFADADLDKAIEGTLRSVFANCGQVCLGTERIFVERPVFEEFVERLAAGTAGLCMGRPEDEATNLGPLVSETHRKKVLGYYDLAADEGATVVIGGGIPEMPDNLAAGSWVQPTIWTGLGDDARTVREEIFGPCCHIAPFDDEDEVVARANDTQYGLAAALWTENVSRAHRVARQLEAGITWVNSWFLRDLRTPFGGMKQSGIGREGGEYSLEFYTETKNICIKL
jgi:aminomuconate-semialdehyde/2-hydroxymuconate-6-semialdehyde dehydrogenase